MQNLQQKIKLILKKSSFVVGAWSAVRGAVIDARKLSWLAVRRRKIQAYLRTSQVKKLQLGTSRSPLPGWLNTDVVPQSSDIVYLDATQRFPLDDNSFEYAACEHMIEHIEFEAAMSMLRELFRILKPGGRVRITTPDLRVLLGLYSLEKTSDQNEYIGWITSRFGPPEQNCGAPFVINNAFRSWGHQYLYDRETLEASMRSCGFEDLKCYKPGASVDPNLRGIESHGAVLANEAINQFESLVLEGRTPDAKGQLEESASSAGHLPSIKRRLGGIPAIDPGNCLGKL
jgi:predicted SAM-dependent methyltransferase